MDLSLLWFCAFVNDWIKLSNWFDERPISLPAFGGLEMLIELSRSDKASGLGCPAGALVSVPPKMSRRSCCLGCSTVFPL